MTVRYQLTDDTQPSGQSGTLLDFNGSTFYFRTNYGNLNHKWAIGIINTNAGRPGTANINFHTNFGEIRYKGLIERCSV